MKDCPYALFRLGRMSSATNQSTFLAPAGGGFGGGGERTIPDVQWPTWYHWLHGYGISVGLAFATVIVFFGQSRVQTEDRESCASPVDMKPWSAAKPIAAVIALSAFALYVGLAVLSAQ